MEVRSVCPGPSQSLLIRFCHGIWAREHGNIAIWWAIPRSVSEHLSFPSALIVFQKLRCITSNVPYKLSMSDAHRCTLAESGALMRRVRRSCAACNEWINGLIFIALMSVGSASAQIVDMNRFTCNDFIGFKRDTALTIVMWLDAYYRDEDDPPIIDFEKMRQKAARLTVYCSQNPTHSLTTAAERIMGSK
jgi:acid stress chaperone HdeB